MRQHTKPTIGKWSSLLILQQPSHDQTKLKTKTFSKELLMSFKPVFLNLYNIFFFTVKNLSVRFLLTYPVYIKDFCLLLIDARTFILVVSFDVNKPINHRDNKVQWLDNKVAITTGPIVH